MEIGIGTVLALIAVGMCIAFAITRIKRDEKKNQVQPIVVTEADVEESQPMNATGDESQPMTETPNVQASHMTTVETQ